MSRSVVEAVDDTKLMQETKHSLFADEQQDKIEHAHPYGFTAVPQKPTGTGKLRMAAEAFLSYMGAGRAHGIAMVVGDRRYRLYKLDAGEVALHDDQGHQVHIKRDGVWVSAPNSKKVVAQIMDDDTLPQDTGGAGGQKNGQIKQAGRASKVNFTLDKNTFTLNHPDGIVNINAKTFNLTVSGVSTVKAGTINEEATSGAVTVTSDKANVNVNAPLADVKTQGVTTKIQGGGVSSPPTTFT
jgi:phage gp45-like